MKTENTFDQLPPDKDLGPTVLIVDDERTARESLRVAVATASHSQNINVICAETLRDAQKVLSERRVNVVLLDKNVGQDHNDTTQDGINFIPEILGMQPHVQIIMVTASDDVQDAVTAIKYGAFGFLTKNSDPELIICQIERALEFSNMKIEKICSDRVNKGHKANELGGESPAWKKVLTQVKAFSESNRPVLLLGETGTGKTSLAKIIHNQREKYLREAKRPFFGINIAAFSSDLVERELFGNERGAYTDAKEQKLGFFELANNGTLFLDEIGDASQDLQVKLLKVIDEGKFFRLGGSKEIYSNFKLICATHRDLEDLVTQGKFREDLYMRISTFQVKVPSLLERKEDIPHIIEAALPRWCRENGVFIKFHDLPADFIDYLSSTPIQGNIRGIEQQVARLLVLSPRDADNRPILKQWRSILTPSLKRVDSKKNEALTLSELMRKRFDVVGPGFPGLKEVVENITDKIFSDAKIKYNGRNNEIARALRISPAAVSIRLRRNNKREGLTETTV